jgi:hypothetical protein
MIAARQQQVSDMAGAGLRPLIDPAQSCHTIRSTLIRGSWSTSLTHA